MSETEADQLAMLAKDLGYPMTFATVVDDAPSRGQVALKIGPLTAYGKTPVEAFENLTVSVLDEGWNANRCPDTKLRHVLRMLRLGLVQTRHGS